MTTGVLLDVGNALPQAVRRFAFSRLRGRRALSKRGPLRHLLLDVSVISRHDAGTGIQRVVRGIMMALLEHPPLGVEIHLVGQTRKRGYCYLDWDGNSDAASLEPKLGETVQPNPASAFIGLDLSLDAIVRHHAQLTQWRAQGMSLHFLVYDLLPISHPEWFTPKLVKRFRRWFSALALLSDSLLVISRTVERDVQHRLLNSYGLVPGQVPTVVVPMGADFYATRPNRGIFPNQTEWLPRFAQRRAVLMVGTLEPRKGHEQVLDAFEVLWQRGGDVSLFIVGRPGWHTEALQARIRNHREQGQRLFWLDDASDELLQQFYQACLGVIVASYAEGFGLSFIEAMSYGKPVLARDIPVFREREQAGVQFFSAHSGHDLAVAITRWLEHIEKTGMPEVIQSAQPRWRDTAAALLDWVPAIHCDAGTYAVGHQKLAPSVGGT